jgi:CRP-like cAMP-binding protein
VLAREMEEGDFFGEISVLSGSVRTATVTAKTRCELLELNRAALDDICGRQPHVREVMKEFSQRRLASDRQVREGQKD